MFSNENFSHFFSLLLAPSLFLFYFLASSQHSSSYSKRTNSPFVVFSCLSALPIAILLFFAKKERCELEGEGERDRQLQLAAALRTLTTSTSSNDIEFYDLEVKIKISTKIDSEEEPSKNIVLSKKMA
jgi:hypothetical protein